MDHSSENHQQREERLAAEKSFQEALDQLNDTFEESLTSKQKPNRKTPQQLAKTKVKFDLASLEDAVADIDEYMKARETYLHSPEPPPESDSESED